jgi:hypothetical protein
VIYSEFVLPGEDFMIFPIIDKNYRIVFAKPRVAGGV